MEITRTGATALNPAMDRTLEPRNTAQAKKAAADTGSTVDEKTEATSDASSLKSFAYGALDLDKPETQAKETDGAYTAGKWLGAAAKVGAVISMLA
ncbi:MAG: hypothetical protein H6Q00_986 [Holophagaceae bacterium]|nr:hypothetical protein [Holophagaceae bacterium]